MLINNIPRMHLKKVKRLTIAAIKMLQEATAPKFANDNSSVIFIAGPPIATDAIVDFATMVEKTQTDLIYLVFEPGRESRGPVRASVMAERFGIVYTWMDCSIWAPEENGHGFLMPVGLNQCFSHDGKALISHESRPTQSLAGGIARARRLIQDIAHDVTKEQLKAFDEVKQDAA